jgi:hypothetical protein
LLEVLALSDLGAAVASSLAIGLVIAGYFTTTADSLKALPQTTE